MAFCFEEDDFLEYCSGAAVDLSDVRTVNVNRNETHVEIGRDDDADMELEMESSGSSGSGVKKRIRKSSVAYSATVSNELTQLEGQSILLNIGCDRHKRNMSGSCNCFMTMFKCGEGLVDMEASVRFFLKQRQSVVGMDGGERRIFIEKVMQRVVPVVGPTGLRGNNEYVLHDGDSTVDVCRTCFAKAFDVTVSEIILVSKSIRGGTAIGAFNVQPYVDSTFFEDITFEDAKLVFNDWCGLSPLRENIQLSQVRSSICNQECFLWMQNYFSLWESCPMSAKIHMDADVKVRIHDQYVKETVKVSTAAPPLSVGKFVSLWKHAYPFVTINKVKRVCGKCWTCAYINELRQDKSNKQLMQAAKKLFIAHRNSMYMPERMEYRRRILHALNNPDSVMSMIVDAASGQHSAIPHYGSDQTFHGGLQQHVNGVLVHGVGCTLYRQAPTVPKCGSATVYILLKELEKWWINHGERFPEVLYIQIDGGGDNANRTMLAFCEYVVGKRMCKKVIITRLPVGHTHEDIDAVFGNLANWFWKDAGQVLTPQEYKTKVEAKFGVDSNSPLKISVEDIFIIPNYKEFFSRTQDKKWEHMCKMEYTQLQWRFKAVQVDEYFPYGVQTTFRRYSSEYSVIIEKKIKFNCSSPLGRLTGLEPTEVRSYWYPSKHTIPGRPVEGFYVLHGLPGLDIYTYDITPFPLAEGCIEEMNVLKRNINRGFQVGSGTRELWNEWFDKYIPTENDTLLYSTQVDYHSPLRIFFAANTFGKLKNIGKATESLHQSPYRQAYALPTVRTSLLTQPATAPYELIPDEDLDNSIVVRYNKFAAESQISHFNAFYKAPEIVMVVRRRMKSSGVVIATSHIPKSGLIIILMTLNEQFIAQRFSFLEPNDRRLLEFLINEPTELEYADLQRIVTINQIPISLNDIYTVLKEDQECNVTVMESMIWLFKERDRILVDTHRETNSSRPHYKERSIVHYLTVAESKCLLSTTLSIEEKANTVPTLLFTMHQVMIPVTYVTPAGALQWLLVELIIDTGKIGFHRPQYAMDYSPEDNAEHTTQEHAIYSTIVAVVKFKYAEVPPTVNKFDPLHRKGLFRTVYPDLSLSPHPDVPKGWCKIPFASSSIFILLAMEFVYFDIQFAWDISEINTIVRELFTFNLLKEELHRFCGT
jgi:hypothetical protein